jgi:hypothetical protein
MNNNTTFSYLIAFVLTTIGALMKIEHTSFSEVVLALGILSLLVFVIMAIKEVNRSSKISDSEKFMWSVGFVTFGGLLGLLYVFSARKRIV